MSAKGTTGHHKRVPRASGAIFDACTVNDAAKQMARKARHFGGECIVMVGSDRIAIAYPAHTPESERAIAADPGAFIGLYQAIGNDVRRADDTVARIAEDIWHHLGIAA